MGRLKTQIVATQKRLAEVAAGVVKEAEPGDEEEEQGEPWEGSSITDLKKEPYFEEVETKLKPDVIVEEKHPEGGEDASGGEEEDTSEEEQEESEYEEQSGENESEEEEKPKPKTETPKRPRKRKSKSSTAAEDGPPKKARTIMDDGERLILEHKLREMGLLNCQLCSEETDSFLGLMRHHRTAHKINNPSINCCQRHFGRASLLSHMKYHLDPDAFKCDECDRVFLAKYKLDVHKLLAHIRPDQVKYSCELCGKGFGRLDHMKRHRQAHGPAEEGEFKCQHCDYKSNFAGGLTNHTKFHHEKVLDFVCEVCGKGCLCKAQLERHIQRHHTKQQSEECEICHKFFFDMPCHMRRAHRVLPEVEDDLLKCELCDYKAARSKIKAHVRACHSGPHLCRICGVEYKSRVGLRDHMESHRGITYNCYFCPLELTTRSNLYNHVSRKHPVEFTERKAKRHADRYAPKVKNVDG